MSLERPWAHVTIYECACGWAGMHWHWDGQRFRSMHDLNRFDVELAEEELRA